MGDTSQLSAGFLLPLLPRSVSARGRSVDFQSGSGGAQEGEAPRPGSAVRPSSPSSPRGASQELWLTAHTWLPLKYLPAIRTEQLVLKSAPGKVASLGTAPASPQHLPFHFPVIILASALGLRPHRCLRTSWLRVLVSFWLGSFSFTSLNLFQPADLTFV